MEYSKFRHSPKFGLCKLTNSKVTSGEQNCPLPSHVHQKNFFQSMWNRVKLMANIPRANIEAARPKSLAPIFIQEEK